MFNRGNVAGEIQMTKDERASIRILEQNVRDLQGELNVARVRIKELISTVTRVEELAKNFTNDQILGQEIRRVVNESI